VENIEDATILIYANGTFLKMKRNLLFIEHMVSLGHLDECIDDV